MFHDHDGNLNVNVIVSIIANCTIDVYLCAAKYPTARSELQIWTNIRVRGNSDYT